MSIRPSVLALSLLMFASARFVSGSLTYDLVGMPYEATHVVVMRGNGTGGVNNTCTCCDVANSDYYCFAPDSNSCTEGPRAFIAGGVSIGHLNGGTKFDIAATWTAEDKIALLLGKGTGKFQFVNNESAYFLDLNTNYESHPIQVLIADLNQDGKGDVISANHEAANITVFINTGTY